MLFYIYPCRFIYSEEVDFDDIEVAVFTVYAAKKYMVNRLTKMAVKFILDHITVENVCLVLEHCKGLDEDHIVSKCYDFINQNAALIIVKDAFALLSEASVINILKSDSVNVLEESLISGLLSWGRMQLVKGGNSAKANDDKMIKNEIKDFLSYIRFPLVSYAKLMELNAQYDLLEASEKDHIHEYQCGKIFPSQCKYNVKLRGCRSITRFSLSDDFALLNLVRKEEIVKRKFHLDFWPQKPNFTLVAINIMNGPYLVRVLVYDHNNQLVSYTQRDFSSWPEQESCKEMTFVLQEPVECEISDEPYKIEVYLGKSNIMFWYDNVIVGKFSGNNDLKIKFYNPEILSKIHYLLG